ncbi:protein toll-like [Littorina saxatilis]|uniref:TIR domain-containing protein n=1 Tax=Littorina saxatilis TaxID=31220 RepID=A0AAN9GIC5_9CAEN
MKTKQYQNVSCLSPLLLFLCSIMIRTARGHCHHKNYYAEVHVIDDVGRFKHHDGAGQLDLRSALESNECCQKPGIRIQLDASAADLTVLSGDTFSAVSCKNRLVTLNVSYNALHVLPRSLLSPLHNLDHLDLSHNRLTTLHAGMLPDHLLTLNVSHNALTTVQPGLFNNTHCLQNILFSYNHIHTIEAGVFHTGMHSVRYADLSHNAITTFEPWPYFFHKAVHVDLTHNTISRFANTFNFTLTRELYQAVVNLTYNNLTCLTPRDFSIYHQGQLATTFQIRNHWYELGHNPWLCNCCMHALIDFLNHSLLKAWAFDGGYLTCAAPSSLRGRTLDFLLQRPDVLVCDVTEDCPEGCECLDTPHHRYLAITCPTSRHNYTHIPRMLPSHGPLSLNLSRQALSSLEAESGDVSRLQVLDVSNNRVKQVLNSFLDAASNLQVLDLRNNLLTSLPAQLQRLSVSNLRLSGNPLQCSCDLVWLGNWVKAVADNVTLLEEVGTTTQRPQQRTAHSLTSSLSSNTAAHREPNFNLSVAESPSHALHAAQDLVTLQCSRSGGESVDVVSTSLWARDCGSATELHIFVGSGVALVVVLAVMGILWRWRYQVRVLADYVLHARCVPRYSGIHHQAYKTPRDQEFEEYDVYLSVDEDDKKITTFVEAWLLPLLEDKGCNPSRVYLPLRQELPGVCKAKNRVERIGQSNKVLVILSHGYVNNGWCRHEFDHACRHLQDHNPKNLVIVVMDNDPVVQGFINDGKTEGKDDLPEKNITVFEEKREHHDCQVYEHGSPETHRKVTQRVKENIGDVEVHGCYHDARRHRGADAAAAVDVLEIDVLRAMDTVNVVDEDGEMKGERNADTNPHQTVFKTAHAGQNGYVRPNTKTRKSRKGNNGNRRPNDGEHNLFKKLRRSRADQAKTKQLEGKQLRQRQFLEELSQYTEDGQQVALEPLRSFLLEGRYVSASERLFKYKLLFEIFRIRKGVDLIDCD